MNRSLLILLLAGFMLHAPAAMLTSYHLGNSLTDQFDGIGTIAHSKGDSLNWKRRTIPGCGIQCLWDGAGLPSDYAGKRFDAVIALAFCNGSQLGVNNDAKYMGLYYDEALRSNANCRLCVFTQWTGTENTTWEAQWHRSLDTTQPGYAQPYGSKAYHETLVLKLRGMYPGKQISLLPVGHVLDTFQHLAAAGRIPGYTGAFGLYADGIHLNSEGKYIQNLVGYSVLFKKDPRGAGLQFNQWSGMESVSQTFAALAQDLVWQTVVRLSALTNVTGTAAGAPASAAGRTAAGRQHPGGVLFTVTGARVAPANAQHGAVRLLVDASGRVRMAGYR